MNMEKNLIIGSRVIDKPFIIYISGTNIGETYITGNWAFVGFVEQIN